MNWINPIISFSAYLGIFMALVIGFQKSVSSRRNSYFALLIGLLSLQILKNVATNGLGIALAPAIYLALQGTCLLIGPTVYLYVRSMLPKDQNHELRVWRHYRLGVIYILTIIIVATVLQQSPALTAAITPPLAITLGYTIMFAQIYHVLWYFHRTHTRLKWYRADDANAELTKRLNWMKAAVWLMAGMIVILIIPFLLITAIGELTMLEYLKQGFLLALSFFINYSAIQSFNRPEIVLTVLKPAAVPPPSQALAWEQLDLNLNRLMTEEKPHLSGELRLNDMAGMLQIAPADLSTFMNQHHQVNFSEFINEHRVKEAQRLLLSDDDQYYSILEIALESGFNSKPTFNRVFKEKTGLTPSEFRKQKG